MIIVARFMLFSSTEKKRTTTKNKTQQNIHDSMVVCDVQVVGMRCGKTRRDNGLACLNSVTRKKDFLFLVVSAQLG